MKPWTDRVDTPLDVVLRNLGDKLGLLNQLRKCETFGEILLTAALWRSRDGWHVVTQGRFEEGYRVDIVIPEAKLCIEVDGVAGHGTEIQRAADERRQAAIEARGWLFLRVSATDAFLHAGECVGPIVQTVRDILARPLPGSPEEELAADIARVERAIANFEAHLAVIDLGDLESRQANEAKLSRLRMQLGNMRDAQALRGESLSWEAEQAILERVLERARVRHGKAA